MVTLYERLCFLCKQKGVSGGKMCAELGLSRSVMTDLKSGRKKGFSAEIAQKIASYFGVSVGYLLGEDEISKEIKKEQTSEESLSDKVTERLREKLPLMTEADLLWLDQLIDLKIAERKNKK